MHSHRRSLGPFVAALLIMTGHTVAQEEAFPVATPESQGMSTEALTNLSDQIRVYLADDQIVGAELLVIKNRRAVWHETFGVSDRENETEWMPHTVCNIRSMSKPLTGAAAQILIDRGLLNLDDPVAKYIESFDTDASREITVRQILTHRSGLPLTVITEAIDQYDNLEAQVAAVGEGGPEFEPDSKFWYSDAGSDVVGGIVAKITGVSLDTFITDELLRPLGMTDTGYILTGDEPIAKRCASLYFGRPGAWTRIWQPDDGPLYPFAWGSQTIYGTPMDYAKFLALWMDNGKVGDRQILSSDAITRTLTPVSEMRMLGSDQPFPTEYRGVAPYYGQMSLLYMPTDGDDSASPVAFGHSGSDGTVGLAWPERDLMILYFTQSRGGPTPLRIESPIDTLLLHPGEAAATTEIPEEYKPYIGIYVANFGPFSNEEFEVMMHNGKLALDIPSQLKFALKEPDDEGKWFFEMTNEIAISFEKDDAGEIDHLKIYQGGMAFEVPRKGSAKAAEMAADPVVDPDAVASFLGIYKDDESEGRVEVLLDGTVMRIKETDETTGFDLVPTDDPARFQVKQVPSLFISFQLNSDGDVVSLTREMGERTWLMTREDDQ